MEGIASKETANRQSQQHRTKKKHIRNVGSKSHPFFSSKHDTKQSSETGRLLSISKVTFSSNLGSAISLISLNSVNTSITRSSFVNNSSPDCGGAIFLGETGPFLNILGSKFIENSAQSSGSAIYVFHYSSLEVCSILVKKSLFMGNVITGDDPTGCGGALAIECLYCNDTTVFLEDVSFMYNSASNGSSTLF